MLSQQSKYALRALVYVSRQPSTAYLKVTDIAEKTDLPAPYLSKILKSLVKAKLLVSRRGKNGGVQLNRQIPGITFMQICAAVEDPIVRSECVLFKKACDKKAPCPFHSRWSSTKSQLLDFLDVTQLS